MIIVQRGNHSAFGQILCALRFYCNIYVQTKQNSIHHEVLFTKQQQPEKRTQKTLFIELTESQSVPPFSSSVWFKSCTVFSILFIFMLLPTMLYCTMLPKTNGYLMFVQRVMLIQNHINAIYCASYIHYQLPAKDRRQKTEENEGGLWLKMNTGKWKHHHTHTHTHNVSALLHDRLDLLLNK